MNNLVQIEPNRLLKVEKILISQPQPTEGSPYFKLEETYKVKIDFKKFISIESVTLLQFRKQKINLLDFTAVIFTSKNAVDNYFRIAKEGKIEIPGTMKFFCVSEQTAKYIQKYTNIRKRKLFFCDETSTNTAGLIELISKHKNEKFIYPCSNIRKEEIPYFLKENKFNYKEAIMYKTVSSDLKDIDLNNYDLIVFFSPSGVQSLFENFPKFEQKNIRIGVFGPTTAKAVLDANLILDIEAPTSNAPSMAIALEEYIKKANNI